MNDFVKITGLTKVYGSRTIINNLNLTVEGGSSVAIMGPSGSGKSTLLNMIGMLEDPTAGTISINGSILPSCNSSKATQFRRNQINYLFQSYALLSQESALTNVLLGMEYVKGKKTDKMRAAKEVLQQLGLGAVMEDKISTLSGGEQQRVSIARCILKPGDLILADEPTGALDKELANRIFSQLLGLQRHIGKTLIVVTHDSTLAAQCDRQIHLTNATTEAHSYQNRQPPQGDQ